MNAAEQLPEWRLDYPRGLLRTRAAKERLARELKEQGYFPLGKIAAFTGLSIKEIEALP